MDIIRKNSGEGEKQLETISVTTRNYLSLSDAPSAIKRKLSIELSNHSYLPRLDDLQSDWVAWTAVPAFKLYRKRQKRRKIESFCSIGTGSGLDVLSAIELFDVRRVGLTDVHEDVVTTAVGNVSRNKKATHSLIIESGYGDLLSPLEKYGTTYDVIYENLPNLPLQRSRKVTEDRTSSVYLAPRKEKVPKSVHQRMLDLHYLALKQAKGFLSPKGSILSVIGARLPLEAFIELGNLAGYESSILLYTWKNQVDANEIVGNYARKQEKGFGPFYFYRVETLERRFTSVKRHVSGNDALKTEQSLVNERLDAVTAFNELKKGVTIGHTVIVLESKVK